MGIQRVREGALFPLALALLCGVDFGNANAVVSVVVRGQIEIVPSDTSRRETPTLVSFVGRERVFGEKARDLCVRNWRGTLTNIKRLVGVKFASEFAKHERKYLFVPTREAPDGYIEVGVSWGDHDIWFTPEQAPAPPCTHLSPPRG